ncbi:MAG: S8 family peptidase, partial [Thermoleophilia bacterium]
MTRPLAPRALAAALVLAAACATPAVGAPAAGDPVPGTVVVGLADDAGPAVRAAVERRAGVRLGRRVTARGARVARVLGPQSDGQALARLRADPAVRWAEPDRLLQAQAVPNDPLFGRQWALANTGQSGGAAGADIRAALAWDSTTGSDRVRIAVVDSGVDATLPDLAPNVGVVNPGEAGDGREANGIDDDGNGFVDDWRGWDFTNGDNNPADEGSSRHGSTVAAVAGARGNDGTGLAGVSWTSRIVPVRGLDASGSGSTADLAAGITYAGSLGARVINASFGGPTNDIVLREAIAGVPQSLVVAAAGNYASDNDAKPLYPCALPFENVVCVAATTARDTFAGDFSSYGRVSVDLAAPGTGILQPPPAGATTAGLASGTSFSAPHVSGVAALILAVRPDASVRHIRQALLAGVVPLPSLSGRVATGGRLDAPNALASIPPPVPGPGGWTGAATDLGPTASRLHGTVPASSARLAYHFEYGTTPAYGQQTPTRPLAPGAARPVAEDVTRLPAGQPLHHRLVVFAVDGVTISGDVASRQPPPPVVPAAVAPPAAVVRAGAPVARVR